MRKFCRVFLGLLSCFTLAFGQSLIGRHVLSGNGSDQPAVIATDSQGFVYVAGNTTSGNFPTTAALETQPPQGSLEVSVSGTPFTAVSLAANSVSAVAASSDGKVVLASTPNGIARSTDQGNTWTAAANALPPAAALAVDPVNPSNAYALVQNGAFYKSTDGGVTWQASGPTLTTVNIGQIAINPQAPSTLYEWDEYTIYKSTDSAQRWQPLVIPNFGSVMAFALAPSQPDVIYASGLAPYGPMLISTDGGSTWKQGANDIFAYGPTALAVDPANASTVWVVDGGMNIRKSTDGAASFQTVFTLSNALGGGLWSVAIDPANPSRVYAATFSNIFESSDGGQTWSTVYSGNCWSLYAAPSHVYAVGGSVAPTVFLAKFDATLSEVVYSTYLATGTVSGIAIDPAGDVYVAGTQGNNAALFNGFVMKVRADDGALLYSTVLNGAVPYAIAIDAGGNAVVAGGAASLAATKGAYQSAPPGTCPGQTSNPADSVQISETTHAFVAKLNPSGAVVYATYIAGSCGDAALGLALDASGAAYVAGETYSTDFPITPDAMAAKFPATYSSGFAAKLSPAGDQLLYSSFVGGGDFTAAHTLALDGAGNVYLAGSTQAAPTSGASSALPAGSGPGCANSNSIVPVVPPNLPVGDNPFVMKMTLSAAPPAFLAVFGGSCRGEADSIALDAAGNIWLAGWNESWDFPTVAPISGLGQLSPQQLDYFRSIMGFLAELNPAGSAVLSATVTDSRGSVAADSTAVYYAGGLGTIDAYGNASGTTYAALVAEIAPAQVSPISIDEITEDSPLVSAANRLPSAVAPGEIVRILGRGIGPQNPAGAKLTGSGTLATAIGGVQVTFNGVPAPLVSAQANQIVCFAPFELDGASSAAVQVQYNGQASNAYTDSVVPQNVDILAVVNADWSLNSSSNPARPGSVVVLFLTGLGQTIPPSSDGAINQLPLALPRNASAVTINSSPTDVAFLGAAAFEWAGISQLNIMVPAPAGGQNSVSVGIGSAGVNVYVAP